MEYQCDYDNKIKDRHKKVALHSSLLLIFIHSARPLFQKFKFFKGEIFIVHLHEKVKEVRNYLFKMYGK